MQTPKQKSHTMGIQNLYIDPFSIMKSEVMDSTIIESKYSKEEDNRIGWIKKTTRNGKDSYRSYKATRVIRNDKSKKTYPKNAK